MPPPDPTTDARWAELQDEIMYVVGDRRQTKQLLGKLCFPSFPATVPLDEPLAFHCAEAAERL